MKQTLTSRRDRAIFATVASGFTLIELMVAITILGVIFVMLASSFHAVAASKVGAERHLATGQESRDVIWQLSNEIRGTVQTLATAQPSHVTVLGQGRMENNAPLDSLTIITLDPGHRRAIEGFGPEDTITYAATPNPNHRGWFVLTRMQTSSLLTTGDNDPNQTMVIADNLLGLHFRYYDGNRWMESWDSASLPPLRQLPQAIMIELALAQADGAPLRLSTMVTLPMAFALW